MVYFALQNNIPFCKIQEAYRLNVFCRRECNNIWPIILFTFFCMFNVMWGHFLFYFKMFITLFFEGGGAPTPFILSSDLGGRISQYGHSYHVVYSHNVAAKNEKYKGNNVALSHSVKYRKPTGFLYFAEWNGSKFDQLFFLFFSACFMWFENIFFFV